MSDTQPNPADFSINAKPREYHVRIRVVGTYSETIMANSQDEADAQARSMARLIENDDEVSELESLDDVDVSSCLKSAPMYRVLRDGKKMQVSRLSQGDLPREPDERGF